MRSLRAAGVRAGLVVLVASSGALAQPEPAPGAAPLATSRDDQQLAEALSGITQDPSIPVADPATRALAQALMVEGINQLNRRSFEQALANFLEAYARFPSPKILLDVAATLRDMGRLADAANTYQRYLLDPASGAERVGEVKQLLLHLDEQLTILTVRVVPRGAEVSIDGGPFIPVGGALRTRVRAGLHLVRIRNGAASSEVTVNGFEGEHKEVAPVLQVDVPEVTRSPEPPPAHVDGWLITGTDYSTDGGTGRERQVRASATGPVISAIVPRVESPQTDVAILPPPTSKLGSGVIGVVRIDGEGRGFAAGAGLAISSGRLEAEIMFLKSSSTGGYLGVRYRLRTGWLRPYLAGGVPGFAYDQLEDGSSEATKKLALGLRGAAGVELRINNHLSVQGDLGYEHFFVDEMATELDANIFVPTVGVIGRL